MLRRGVSCFVTMETQVLKEFAAAQIDLPSGSEEVLNKGVVRNGEPLVVTVPVYLSPLSGDPQDHKFAGGLVLTQMIW